MDLIMLAWLEYNNDLSLSLWLPLKSLEPQNNV